MQPNVYNNTSLLLHNIQRMTSHADQTQILSAVKCLSRYSGNDSTKTLENLYDDLCHGIPFRYTAVGKAFYLGM